MIAFFQKGAIFDFDYFSNKNCDRNCYKNLFVIVDGHLFPVPCLQKYDFNIPIVEVDILCTLISNIHCAMM